MQAQKTISLRRDLLLTAGVSTANLLVSYLLIGFRPEQTVLVALDNRLYYLSAPTNWLVVGFFVFIVC